MASNDRSRMAQGYVMVLAATLIWSGNFVLARILQESVPPFTIVVLRSLIAIAAMAPFVARPMYYERRIILKHIKYIALTAFLGITVCNTIVYIAASSSNAVNLALIAISSPIFTILFARVLLKEALGFRKILSLVLASSGVLYLVTGGAFSRLATLSFTPGDIWMLGQASSFALYSILVQKRPLELSPLPFLFTMFVVGMMFVLPFFAWELVSAQRMEFSERVIWAIIFVGLGPSVLAYMSWNRSVALIGPSKAAFVYYCLPLFSGIEAQYLLGEDLTFSHLISGALILTGIILSTRD